MSEAGSIHRRNHNRVQHDNPELFEQVSLFVITKDMCKVPTSQLLKSNFILYYITLLIQKRPNSVLVPSPRSQSMEILSVSITKECPFSAAFKLPGKKKMVRQCLFSEAELRKSRLFILEMKSEHVFSQCPPVITDLPISVSFLAG